MQQKDAGGLRRRDCRRTRAPDGTGKLPAGSKLTSFACQTDSCTCIFSSLCRLVTILCCRSAVTIVALCFAAVFASLFARVFALLRHDVPRLRQLARQKGPLLHSKLFGGRVLPAVLFVQKWYSNFRVGCTTISTTQCTVLIAFLCQFCCRRTQPLPSTEPRCFPRPSRAGCRACSASGSGYAHWRTGVRLPPQSHYSKRLATQEPLSRLPRHRREPLAAAVPQV